MIVGKQKNIDYAYTVSTAEISQDISWGFYCERSIGAETP